MALVPRVLERPVCGLCHVASEASAPVVFPGHPASSCEPSLSTQGLVQAWHCAYVQILACTGLPRAFFCLWLIPCMTCAPGPLTALCSSASLAGHTWAPAASSEAGD